MKLALIIPQVKDGYGTTESHRKKRIATASQKKFTDYFDLLRLTAKKHSLDGMLHAYTGKRDWLHYKPDFIYRYAKVNKSIWWGQLVDLCVAAREHVHRFQP